jgi:hypothetical protein
VKLFPLLWQNFRWQKISICKCEIHLPFDMEKVFAFQLSQAMFFSNLMSKLKDSLPEGIQMGIRNPQQMEKKNHFCNWIFFAISSIPNI